MESKNVVQFLSVWDEERDVCVELPGSGGGGCPGIMTLDSGEIAVVGKFLDVDILSGNDGCRVSVGKGECAVVIPTALFEQAIERYMSTKAIN